MLALIFLRLGGLLRLEDCFIVTHAKEDELHSKFPPVPHRSLPCLKLGEHLLIEGFQLLDRVVVSVVPLQLFCRVDLAT